MELNLLKGDFPKILFASLFILFPISSLAATPNFNLPGSAEPGRAGKPLQIQKRIIPTFMPELGVPQAEEPKLSKEAASIRFRLNGIVIEGNTVFPQADLYWLFRQYLDTEVSLGDLERIVHQITLKYREAGYILSRAYIPQQKVDNGVVVVKVIEGFIDKVIVEGNPGKNRCLIEAYGARIVASGPLNIYTLERYILLTNDLPSVKAQAVLKASATTPNAATLSIITEDKRYNAYANVNNRGTRLEGPFQYLVGGSVNSLFRGGESTEFRAAGAMPSRELQYYEILHQEQIGSDGLKLLLDANHTRTRPGAFLTPIDIHGIDYSFAGTLSYPFMRTREENLLGDTTFNYIRSRSTLIGNQLLFDDKIYSFNIGSSYDVTDKTNGTNYLSGHLTQGLPIFNASPNGSTVSRAGARNDFTKFNVDAARLQNFTEKFSALLAARAQYALNPLYSVEQFGVGSVPFGGAYDPSEIIGDHGLAVKLELRYLLPSPKYFPMLQLYTYYDGGKIWNRNSTNQPAKQSLTSAGLGLRWQLIKYFDGYLEVAKPLTRAVSIEQSDGKNGKAPRVFFGVTGKI